MFKRRKAEKPKPQPLFPERRPEPRARLGACTGLTDFQNRPIRCGDWVRTQGRSGPVLWCDQLECYGIGVRLEPGGNPYNLSCYRGFRTVGPETTLCYALRDVAGKCDFHSGG